MSEQARESGENVSAIQSLVARAQDLSRAVGHWNNVYMVMVALTVVLAAGVFVAQFVAIREGRLLASTQNELMTEKDRQSALDSKDKDLKIADAKQAAEEAKERARALEMSNIRLHTDLERATADSRSTQARLEGEQQKTAKAQEDAAKAQLTLQKYISVVADRQRPRELDRDKFVKNLEGKPKATALFWYSPGDTEAYWFANAIFTWLGAGNPDKRGAGWAVSPPVPIPPNAGYQGQNLSAAPPAMRFFGVFTPFGLTFVTRSRPSGSPPPFAAPNSSDALGCLMYAIGVSALPSSRAFSFAAEYDDSLPEGVVLVVVGPKPPRFLTPEEEEKLNPQ